MSEEQSVIKYLQLGIYNENLWTFAPLQDLFCSYYPENISSLAEIFPLPDLIEQFNIEK